MYFIFLYQFSLYIDHIIQNAELDLGGGVKVGGSNISNLRYAVNTILLVENSNGLK